MKNKYYGIVALAIILVLAFLGYRFYNSKFGASVDRLEPGGVTAYGDLAAGDASTRFVATSIGSGTSTKIIVNRAPFTRWIRDGSLLTITGNATDTPYRIYVGTTTSIGNAAVGVAGNGQNVPLYVAPPFAGLVSNYVIATSTDATSTPLSHLSRATGAGSYQGVFPWKSGEGLFMVLQVDTGNAGRNGYCPGQTGAELCTAATGTTAARGFDVELLLDTYSTSTVR